jgi:transposase
LGRTLKKRAADVLAYIDGTSNGPAEPINGRLEHLRGFALGFRDLPIPARTWYRLCNWRPFRSDHRARGEG